MVQQDEAGLSDSADSMADEPRTCIGCRRSKVKCNMALPCSRCTRLSLECVPTPPSQRGRPGERQKKRRRRTTGMQTDEPDMSLSTKYHAIMINTFADGFESAKEGG